MSKKIPDDIKNDIQVAFNRTWEVIANDIIEAEEICGERGTLTGRAESCINYFDDYSTLSKARLTEIRQAVPYKDLVTIGKKVMKYY